MNKICRQYIKEVKTLFPIIRKPERTYLSKLTQTVEEYSEEENIDNIEELYSNFGYPNDVVNSYLSGMDLSVMYKNIRTAKWIQKFIIVLMVAVIIAVSIFAIVTYKNYKMDEREHEIFEQEQIFFKEETIE